MPDLTVPMSDSNPIKQSIIVLFNAKSHQEVVEQFAYEKYLEEYGKDNANGYSRYDGFEVKSENEIKVKFVKRICGSKCNGSFTVGLN